MVLLFFTHCKEEPVQPKEAKSTVEISAAKKTSEAQLALLLDDDKTAKQKEFEKLKAEHEKPFMMLKKPIVALREYLAARKAGKNVDGSKKVVNQKTIMQQLCNPIYVDNWVFEKYQPASGTIGILPPQSWQTNPTNLNILRNQYGFRQVVMVETAIQSNTSSFSKNEMIVCLTDLSVGLNMVNNNSNTPENWCGGLYFEEPLHNGAGTFSQIRNQVFSIKAAWKTKFGSNSPVYLGETTTELINELDEQVDYVNSTIYDNYTYYLPYSNSPFSYFFHSDDQRPTWTACNSTFGSKFDFVWINASDDQNEMGQLIGHAINLGKNNIWLYNPWGDMNHTNQFCSSAYYYGLLSRWSRKYLYEYTYIGTGDPCTDDDETHWWLTEIITTQIVEQD